MNKQIPPVRRKSIENHLKGDQDYFGTLAAILDLMRQDIGRNAGQKNSELLERLRDDLMYLQDSYRITPKRD